MSRALRTWAPALVWTVLLFAASSRSTLPVSLDGGLDKVAHFGAYSVLGFLLARAFHRSGRAAWLAVPLGWATGALDEVYQGFVPGRTPSVGDWIADAAGIAAGLVIYLLVVRASARRSPERIRSPQPQDGW